MSTLDIKPISADSETANFHCGNSSIEAKVRRSYYASLLQEGYGYEIILDKKLVVGYYMISLTMINGTEVPQDVQDYSSGLYHSICRDHSICNVRYAAVAIDYLAIDKRFQGNQIGTNVLKGIVRTVRGWSQMIPIRYIMVDALKEKVAWYEKRGFFINDASPVAPNDATVKMLIDCLRNEAELKQYLSTQV